MLHEGEKTAGASSSPPQNRQQPNGRAECIPGQLKQPEDDRIAQNEDEISTQESGQKEQFLPLQNVPDDETFATPLNFEPCSNKKIERHIALLKTEIEEHQEMIKKLTAEMEYSENRIRYKVSESRAEKMKQGLFGYCCITGCDQNAQKRNGVCPRHGRPTATVCTHEGCNNLSTMGGFCNIHCERKYCTHEECTNFATKGELRTMKDLL